MSDETKTKVLTEEDLKSIAGGTDQEGNKVSGISCPQCYGFIPITIQQILSGSAVFCPCCGLRLEIAKIKSEKAHEILNQQQHEDGLNYFV